MLKIFSYFKKRPNTVPCEEQPGDFVTFTPSEFIPDFDFPSFKDCTPGAIAYHATFEDDGSYQIHYKAYKEAPKYRVSREIGEEEYKAATRDIEYANKQKEATARMLLKCKKLENKFDEERDEFEARLENIRIAYLKKLITYLRKVKNANDPKSIEFKDQVIANVRERLAARIDFERQKFERVVVAYNQKRAYYWSKIEQDLDMEEGPVVFDTMVSALCTQCLKDYDAECAQYYAAYTEMNGAVVSYANDLNGNVQVYPGQSLSMTYGDSGIHFGTTGAGANMFVRDEGNNTILLTVNKPPRG